MMRFNCSIRHVPGKLLYTADALSRPPSQEPLSTSQITSQAEVESYIDSIIAKLPASGDSLRKYLEAKHSDSTCSEVIDFYKTKRPEQHAMKSELKPYW